MLLFDVSDLTPSLPTQLGHCCTRRFTCTSICVERYLTVARRPAPVGYILTPLTTAQERCHAFNLCVKKFNIKRIVIKSMGKHPNFVNCLRILFFNIGVLINRMSDPAVSYSAIRAKCTNNS